MTIDNSLNGSYGFDDQMSKTHDQFGNFLF